MEPVHFVTDEKVLSYEENKRRVSERLTQLESVVEYYNTREENPIDTYLILVIENEAGLKELVSIMKNKSLSFFMNRCLFTNEYVVSRNAGKNVGGAMLGMEVKERTISFVQRNLPFDLDEE